MANFRAGRRAGPSSTPNGVAPPPRPTLPLVLEGSPWLIAGRATAAQLQWLLPGLIPRGRLTLIVGEAAVGKSTLYAALIAAHTTGTADVTWAGASVRAAGQAVLYSPEGADSEEGLGRLRAAGADLQRVALGDVPGERYRDARLVLPDRLEIVASQWAAHRVSLVVIDPIASYLGPETSLIDSGAVRAMLEGLSSLAEQRDVTILGTAHYRKMRGGGPLDWIAGAAAWSQVPRHIVALGRSPHDPRVRVIAAAKQSTCCSTCAYSFSLEDRDGYGAWRLGRRLDLTAADLGRAPDEAHERDARADAEQLLREALATEEVRAKAIVTRAREEGLGERTLRAAKARLGVTSHHAGTVGDRHRVWRRPEVWPDGG